MYTMTLADGTEIEFDGVNGNNFIVPGKKEMDVDVFSDENLVSGTVKDGDGNEYPFENLSFTQQQKQLNGDYYVCFHEKTAQEILNESMEELLVELAEIAIEDEKASIEDLPPLFQEKVKAKMDADKRLEL